MREKWLYIVLGLMAGIILMLVMGKIPVGSALASGSTNLDSASAGNFIALTTITPRAQSSILWVFDTKNKKVLVYEYTNENQVTFKAFRDAQYDFDIPDGLAASLSTKKSDWSPKDTKEWFDKIKKQLADQPPR